MTNAEILSKAYRGKAALKERQRQLTKEHTERSKKLDHLMDEITSGDFTGQMSIAGTGAIELSEDLRDLLENPCHGL